MGYICIHGHFYQPPRENAWLEAIELQESAAPYHDWNERVDAECYAPNAASRIVDEENRIVSIVNNYAKISFNFGPTLLSWMAPNDTVAYRAILQADADSQKAYSGHGCALAQAYSHMIMPLANERDQYTQVHWGLQDFEHRFGRKPEGMWLPETAVDTGTLERLAEVGIKFTILSPSQASRVKKISGRNWKDVSNTRIDPTMAYLCALPSGRTISLFFYDGPISHDIAFEGLLDNGERFAQRLLGAFSEDTRAWPELVHIATDGETYGHHHKYGERALTYALNYIESNKLAQLTNYGEYLERHPPTYMVEVFQNSSWSCAHGVERWRSNCGCNSGGHPGWNQEWRAPLRAALDWLRDELTPLFEERAAKYLRDPWAARNDYIGVVLDRSPENRERFLAEHATKTICEPDQTTVWKLMELQRHAMLMYTSCGWFFDELSGIETVQVIQYAGRAVQLAEELFGNHREEQFIERLSAAKSNIPEHSDGGKIYEKFVKSSFVNLHKVGGHYAIRSLFEPYETETQIYHYKVQREEGLTLSKGEKDQNRFAVGQAKFTSGVTQESQVLSFAALNGGDYNPLGAILKVEAPETYADLAHCLTETFRIGDVDQLSRLLRQKAAGEPYTLAALFRDDQQRILNRMIESEWNEAEAAFSKIYPHLISMIKTLGTIGASLNVPKAFHTAAEFVLNARLRRAFASEPLDYEGIRNLLADSKAAQVQFDKTMLEYSFRTRLEKIASAFQADDSNLELLTTLDASVGLAESMSIDLHLWKIQNICYQLLQNAYPEHKHAAAQGDRAAGPWTTRFQSLAEKLSLRVP